MSANYKHDHNTLQSRNRDWWEKNPMTYDWTNNLQFKPGTPEFYDAIDERFFRSAAHFGHPNYPSQPPFSRQVDYPALRGKRVLEIGCGSGAMTANMALHGLDVSAVDISQSAVNLTQQRLSILGLTCDVQRADAEQLPYHDCEFALVWSWGVIHHSASMQSIIDEIWRVLKPEGQAKIMVYHRHSLRNWIMAGLYQGVFRGKFLSTSYDDILREVTDGYIARHLTRDEMRRMFSRFRRVKIELTDLADLSFLPGNIIIDRYLIGRLIPAGLKSRWDSFLMGHWGWFLFLEATK